MIRIHRISDWNVFYGITGKTDYAKQMGKFVLARLIFEILIVLPFRILILLPLYLTGIALGNHTKQQESIKRFQIKKLERAQKVLLQLEKLMPEISTADTKAKRKSKTMRALTLLDELERLGQKEVVYDFEQVKEDLRVVLRTADAIDYLDKADKQLFLRNKKREINYLLNALYSLISKKVTNGEFDSLKAVSEYTNIIWTVKRIKERLVQAGYSPSPSQ